MAWSSLVSYWSMLGLAAQSSRWEQNMNAKLIQMAASTAKATSLHAASAKNEELALQAEATADADTLQAGELQQQAEALLEKAEADQALAASEQVGAEELEVEIVTEVAEAAAHAGVAAADEAALDAEFSEGTADATEAAESEAEAHGEELGVAFCELIPLLDLFCDVVGGVTAVGMEVSAAAEATKAATEFAAATASKADEESELALAGDLQAKGAEDTEMATELQADEAELEELAQEEKAEGLEEEAATDTLFKEAEVEQEAVAENVGEAAVEENAADAYAEQALMHGVAACWDAMMAGVVGVFAFGYYALRTVFSLVVPGMISTVGFLDVAFKAGPSSTPIVHSLGRDLSYVLHHCVIFLLSIGYLGTLLVGLEKNSIRARGGVILLFAVVGGLVQTLVLHSVPSTRLKSRPGICWIIRDALSRTLVMTILFALEILILLVILGHETLFSPELLASLDKWWWKVLFVSTLAAHLWFLEMPRSTHDQSRESKKVETNSSTPFEIAAKSHSREPTESDLLLGAASESPKQQDVRSGDPTLTTSVHMSFRDEFNKLQLPFEILVLSCMLALLRHCIPSLRALWPASKAMLRHARPDWVIPFGIGFGLLVIALVVAGVLERRHRGVL
jgi:chemotaxis protein histidine kinase CheA